MLLVKKDPQRDAEYYTEKSKIEHHRLHAETV